MAVYQELALDKNGNPSVIKSWLLINGGRMRKWPFIKSQLLINAEELRRWPSIKSWLLIKWEIQRYQEPALDKCPGIEKMTVYQELDLIKMENPSFIKSWP